MQLREMSLSMCSERVVTKTDLPFCINLHLLKIPGPSVVLTAFTMEDIAIDDSGIDSLKAETVHESVLLVIWSGFRLW